MDQHHSGIITPFANKVRRIFLHWRQADEDETWSLRAIKALEKKLRERGDDSYALFFNEVLEKKSAHTPCVTLNRSQDGRIQVSHKKMLPHVLSCRIFRWPDLQTHQELKSIEDCRHPGNDKKSKVCINPYHYERVAQPVYPPVLRRTAAIEECPSTAISPMCPPMSPSFLSSSSIQNELVQTWCKVTYWELSSRVGEPFAANTSAFIIDGVINPNNDMGRFSLGSLSNINRNSCIEMTRRAIGGGVRIEKNQMDVFAQNLSKSPIFFLSRNHNVGRNFRPLDVIRVPPGCIMKIFDNNVFENLVMKEMESIANRYERVLSLNTHCSIKMSFVKGWGPDYQRQEVTSTPCWIDITLHEPLAYLDARLRELGSPNGHITSTS